MKPVNNLNDPRMIENALVIGSEGIIARAICNALSSQYHLYTLSRSNTGYELPALQDKAQSFIDQGISFTKIICCIGTLLDEQAAPEKSLKDINEAQLMHYFKVNAVLPMLCLQAFIPTLHKTERSVFASLSAMVGSTQDNRLGGWYGYRSSKAALNNFIKTTSIELARINKQALVIAVHPGTTQGSFTAPFKKNIDPNKYYTPEQSASRIIDVMNSSESKSGGFYNWDGSIINY